MTISHKKTEEVRKQLKGLPGPDGKVEVYDLATEKVVKVWPVDAAELLASGAVSLSAPEPKKKQHTVPQLKAMAAEAGIEGYDTMKKAELVEALAALESNPDDSEDDNPEE